jgi:hypothetical protein
LTRAAPASSWAFVIMTKESTMNANSNLQPKSNVLPLNKQKSKPARRGKKHSRKAIQPSIVIAAAAILAVALILVGLSLSHLAEGVQIVTGSEPIGAWSMAAGIDLGFVVLEIALLVAPVELRPAVSQYASPAIKGTLATSAAMNTFAFASHAHGLMICPAIALGCAIPCLIYALTKTGAALSFHKS